MRLLIVGSCGKRKLTSNESAPGCEAITSKKDLSHWCSKFESLSRKAREMYIGHQHCELVKGIDALREIADVEVVFKIVSAGFGIVDENERIPPYDCSFSGMKKSSIRKRAQGLSISNDFSLLCTTGFDLIYLALGASYLYALGDDWSTPSDTTLVGFNDSLPGIKVVKLPSNHKIVHAFSIQGYTIHGVTGFKGDLLRILATYALTSRNPYEEVLRWKRPTNLYDLVLHLSGLPTLH